MISHENTAPAPDITPDETQYGVEHSTNIDWEAMDRRLGFNEPGNPVVRAPADDFEIAGRMLGEILEFITAPSSLQAIGGRAVGIAACLRPQLFENQPMTALADKFGMSKQALNKYFRRVRDRFGLKSVYCKTDEAREKYRAGNIGKTRKSKPE